MADSKYLGTLNTWCGLRLLQDSSLTEKWESVFVNKIKWRHINCHRKKFFLDEILPCQLCSEAGFFQKESLSFHWAEDITWWSGTTKHIAVSEATWCKCAERLTHPESWSSWFCFHTFGVAGEKKKESLLSMKIIKNLQSWSSVCLGNF